MQLSTFVEDFSVLKISIWSVVIAVLLRTLQAPCIVVFRESERSLVRDRTSHIAQHRQELSVFLLWTDPHVVCTVWCTITNGMI